jgi:nucleoside 2-deoxyribosyltransferase
MGQVVQEMVMTCAIWESSALTVEKGGDFEIFDSPRAGGKYRISGTALGQIVSFNYNAKTLLTTWLCEQRHAGVEIPNVESNVLDLIKSRRRLSVPSRLTAALLFIGRHISELGSSISIGGDNAETLRFCAETESHNIRETSELLTMLRNMSFVDGAFSTSGLAHVHPTLNGWQELERLELRKSDSAQAFVAMWFNDATNDAFVNGIGPAIAAAGYKPIRIDKKEHNNKIDDEIIAEIRRSRFLVADFTCELGKTRGGVYYEAGFALGLGIPVIWTCKNTSMDDLHFDTRQYAHIVWKDAGDLLVQLKNRIGATIGDGPLPKT